MQYASPTASYNRKTADPENAARSRSCAYAHRIHTILKGYTHSHTQGICIYIYQRAYVEAGQDMELMLHTLELTCGGKAQQRPNLIVR